MPIMPCHTVLPLCSLPPLAPPISARALQVEEAPDLDDLQHEIIFVVDRSGSMSGASIRACIATLEIFVRSLPPSCRFNIIGFGDSSVWTWTPPSPSLRVYRIVALVHTYHPILSFFCACRTVLRCAAWRSVFPVPSRPPTTTRPLPAQRPTSPHSECVMLLSLVDGAPPPL